MAHAPARPEILSEIPALFATSPSSQVSAGHRHMSAVQHVSEAAGLCGGRYRLSTRSTCSPPQRQAAFCDSVVKQHQTCRPCESSTRTEEKSSTFRLNHHKTPKPHFNAHQSIAPVQQTFATEHVVKTNPNPRSVSLS